MSGFDLPPVTGYDQFFKRASLAGDRGVEGLQGDKAPSVADPASGDVALPRSSFEGALADSIGAVRSLQQDVSSKYKGLVLGDDVELHDVMLAANKSEVMFNLMLEVRNKLVEAWEKLSRSAV